LVPFFDVDIVVAMCFIIAVATTTTTILRRRGGGGGHFQYRYVVGGYPSSSLIPYCTHPNQKEDEFSLFLGHIFLHHPSNYGSLLFGTVHATTSSVVVVPLGSGIIHGLRINERFGRTLGTSTDGTTLMVGSEYQRYVYKFQPSMNYNFETIRVESIGNIRIALSASMSADGSTFVVGAPYDDFAEVTLYKFNATRNAYTPIGSNINGTGDNDNFGYSVSMSADALTIAVGAPSSEVLDANNTIMRSGQVRIYQYNENQDAATQIGSDLQCYRRTG
jgi:hypothetical protein